MPAIGHLKFAGTTVLLTQLSTTGV